jgi:hypothetical protein
MAAYVQDAAPIVRCRRGETAEVWHVVCSQPYPTMLAAAAAESPHTAGESHGCNKAQSEAPRAVPATETIRSVSGTESTSAAGVFFIWPGRGSAPGLWGTG